MDEVGFRDLLIKKKCTEGQIQSSISLAKRFETYLSQPGRQPNAASAWDFSRQLIREGANTEENYLALARYCLFISNNEMFIAILELIDGGEVGENLYRMVGEQFGNQVRDEIYDGLDVAPYGTPSPEKPAYIHPIIHRLEVREGDEACRDFLSACLRNLPNNSFLPERRKFNQAGDIDAYLVNRKQAFMAELEDCHRKRRLFFAQEISGQVLDFVRRDPEMGGGKRDGNVIFETKIPYQTMQYLAESDPTLKRYYACHCPWARDAIKNGDVELAKAFCQCSGGFHKKPFEVIFQKPLKVEVLESAIRGDDRCRFAIYLLQ
jgi:hypothetical protein